MDNIKDINKYLNSQGLKLEFDSIESLVNAYLSCRNANKNLLIQSSKTIEQVRLDIENDYIKTLAKDTYKLSQLENMTLIEIAQLML